MLGGKGRSGFTPDGIGGAQTEANLSPLAPEPPPPSICHNKSRTKPNHPPGLTQQALASFTPVQYQKSQAGGGDWHKKSIKAFDIHVQ